MSNPWFRMYAEAVDDDKLRLLAFEDRWHFVAILCCKAQGVLDSHPETLDRRVAVKLGLQLRDADEVKRRLMEVELIDENWQPLAWDRRQFKSDQDFTAGERKQRQREREKLKQPPPANTVTNVTDESRVTVTNVTRTESDTDTETDPETETETEISKKGISCVEPHTTSDAPPSADANTQENPSSIISIKQASPKGTRLPQDFIVPEDWIAWANQNFPLIDAHLEAAKFCDYWSSVTGRQATKLNWKATWRNWIRNARPSRPVRAVLETQQVEQRRRERQELEEKLKREEALKQQQKGGGLHAIF